MNQVAIAPKKVRSLADVALALFGRAQMIAESDAAAAAQGTVVIGASRIVGVTDQIGHRRVAQHATAVG